MNEHRRAPRLQTDAIVQVTNSITGELAGRIGNLSIDGMLLLANQPARDDSLFQFTFSLSDQRGQSRELEIGMHEQWSEPASVPGKHWIGFRFIDIGDQDQAVLNGWLERAGAE